MAQATGRRRRDVPAGRLLSLKSVSRTVSTSIPPMIYRALADLVVLLHAAFIVFAVLGALLAVRFPRVAWLHVPCVLWGVVLEATGARCPLTPVEIHFRELAGLSSYPGGFIEHYLVPAIYPPGLGHSEQWLLAVALLGVNAVLYAVIWRHHRPSARG